MALTLRTALLGFAGVLVVALGWPSMAGVATVTGVIVVLAGVDLALAGRVRALHFTRSGAASVRLGESVEVELMITNPTRRGVRGVVRDAWTPSAGAAAARHPIAIPAGERRRVTTTLIPTRRGDRHAYRVTVRSVGPLGLAARQGSHDVPWAVRVLPPFESRKHLPSRLARLRELDGRASVMLRGQGTEFDSLRDYVVGDDVRSIDWRATARRRDVVVRTWRPERDRHVLIVLDTGRTSAGRIGDTPRLDHAIDAALLLAVLATKAGDRVDLLAVDRRVRVDLRRAGRNDILSSLTDALATLDSELVEVDHRALVSAIALRASQRSLVVLLTGLESTVIEEGLLPVLGRLTHRHQLVLGSIADPVVGELARGRGHAAAVYAAGAAEASRAERQRVVGLLERQGVTVLDEPPGRIAPALADTYLALKRAGRL